MTSFDFKELALNASDGFEEWEVVIRTNGIKLNLPDIRFNANNPVLTILLEHNHFPACYNGPCKSSSSLMDVYKEAENELTEGCGFDNSNFAIIRATFIGVI